MKVLITITRQVLVSAHSAAEAQQLYVDKGDEVVDEVLREVIVSADPFDNPAHRVSTEQVVA